MTMDMNGEIPQLTPFEEQLLGLLAVIAERLDQIKIELGYIEKKMK